VEPEATGFPWRGWWWIAAAVAVGIIAIAAAVAIFVRWV
jgi:hypothetical protein